MKEEEPKRKIDIVIEQGLIAKADDGLIRVVLENLISNAWKFTGKVKNPRIEFGTTKTDGKTAFFVSDNGSGFKMDYADKLFIAFQRLHTDKEFPGMGIGLATVQRIINLHGGKIWAESQEGEGTTFYFIL